MICDALFSIARLITRLCKYTDKATSSAASSSSPWAFFFFFAKYKYKIKKNQLNILIVCQNFTPKKKGKEKEKLAG